MNRPAPAPPDPPDEITQAQMEREWEDTYLLDALRRTRAEVRYWRKRAEDAERAHGR